MGLSDVSHSAARLTLTHVSTVIKKSGDAQCVFLRSTALREVMAAFTALKQEAPFPEEWEEVDLFLTAVAIIKPLVSDRRYVAVTFSNIQNNHEAKRLNFAAVFRMLSFSSLGLYEECHACTRIRKCKNNLSRPFSGDRCLTSARIHAESLSGKDWRGVVNSLDSILRENPWSFARLIQRRRKQLRENTLRKSKIKGVLEDFFLQIRRILVRKT